MGASSIVSAANICKDEVYICLTDQNEMNAEGQFQVEYLNRKCFSSYRNTIIVAHLKCGGNVSDEANQQIAEISYA